MKGVAMRGANFLGYGGAAFTVLLALLVPFVLMGGIARAVAHAGLRVSPMYTGGSVVRVVERPGYRIEISATARPHWFERGQPFVQVAFTSASALPAQIDETLDLDGDGRPDVRMRFAVPRDEKTPLHGAWTALNSHYASAADASRTARSALLVRTHDRVLARVEEKQ
jgi:hypothetical protein